MTTTTTVATVNGKPRVSFFYTLIFILAMTISLTTSTTTTKTMKTKTATTMTTYQHNTTNSVPTINPQATQCVKTAMAAAMARDATCHEPLPVVCFLFLFSLLSFF